MRIEQQGTYETQPVYQHVGYTAAAYDSYLPEGRPAFPALSLSLMVGMIALALIVGRRWSSGWRWLVVAALGTCALGAGLSAVAGAVTPTHTISDEFYQTLYSMEQACALTEGWIEELRRVPTPEEWAARMQGQTCRVDGWGHPFVYKATPGATQPGWDEDGQAYTLISNGLRLTTLPNDESVATSHLDFPSPFLGRDGVFDTDDDYFLLRARLRRTRLDSDLHAHGREPRVVR